MRIFSNILRTFKVSRRESCKITNRRYSSQICPRICVRSFTTTTGSSKNGALDGCDKGTSNPIVPVAFLKADTPNADSPLKILVIPINLFNGDDEAIQKTVSTMSALRNHAEQIEAFTDNAGAISDKNYMPNRKYAGEMPVGAPRKMQESLWQDIEIESSMFGDKKSFYDQIDEAITEYEGNDSRTKNSLNTLNWTRSKRHVLSDIPENLKKSLGEAAITSMNLAFEMDMTNIKDALMNHNKLAVDMEPPTHSSLKDATVKLTTGVESEFVEAQETIPLNFNALIHGTVNIDSSKMTAEKLEDIEIPQFNDYVTAIAANICSTALQKGFPADISRMYSTKTPDPPSKPRSPHVVCVREGDKGCVSPGNVDLDPYVPKGKSASSAESKTSADEKPCSSNASEPSLLTSTIIGDLGARGLMSCQAYVRAQKEASRLRELAANEKQCKKSKDKNKGENARPCDPSIPCGPPKQDNICKGKTIKDPEPRAPLNNPCRQQDGPCDKKADSLVQSTETSCDSNVDMLVNKKIMAAPVDSEDPPCKKLPYRCPKPKKPSHEEKTEHDNDPCRHMYPEKCPPSSSRGDCQKPIIDPCKEQNKCEKPKKEKKPQDLPCNTKSPCKKASGSENLVIKLSAKKEDSTCTELNKEASAGKDQKAGSTGAQKCGEKKPTAPNCQKGNESGEGGKKEPTGISANPCAEKKEAANKNGGKNAEKKAEPPKCGAEKKPEPPKCGAEKKPEPPKCGAEKKPEPPKCGAEKKPEPPKCGAEKKPEPPKCGAEKKPEPPKCGAEKKPEPPKCGAEKKPEPPKCGAEKKPEPPKCGAEKKPEPPKCGAEKKPEPPKCGAEKKPEPPKCGAEKKPEPPKCGAEKKPEPLKCGAEKKPEPPKCGAEKKPEPPKCGAEKKPEPPKCGAEKKPEPPKCGAEKKPEPPKCGAEKKPEPPKCGAEKKPEPPKCGAEKKPEPPKCGAEKKPEPPKCGAEKKPEPPKCGAEKKPEPPKCGAEKKPEPPKCGAEKKTEASKCSAQKAEPKKPETPKCEVKPEDKIPDSPECNAQKRAEPPKCGAEKIAESAKCGAEKKPEPPKCGAEKKPEPPKCGAEKKPEPAKCAEEKPEQAECAEKKLEKKAEPHKCDSENKRDPPKCGEQKGEQKCGLKKLATAPNCNPEKHGNKVKTESATKSQAAKSESLKKMETAIDGDKSNSSPVTFKSIYKAPVIKLGLQNNPETLTFFRAVEPKFAYEENKISEVAPISADLLMAKLTEKRKAPRMCEPENKSTLVKSAVIDRIQTPEIEDDKKQESSDNINKSTNTVLPFRSTKPNCPNTDQPRLFSTLSDSRIYTPLQIEHENFFLNSANYGAAAGDDDSPTCPKFPPRPMHRKDVKRVPKDCFHQDRLDDPCHRPPPVDPTKTACAKKVVKKKCWEKDDKENKLPQRRLAVQLVPGKNRVNNMQKRYLSSSSVKMQHEKKTKHFIDATAEEGTLEKPLPEQKQTLSELSNQVIRIGTAGEVLQVVEKIKNLSDYDVLIRIAAIAISGSDIHVYETGSEQCQGMTIGHDATGVVENVGKCVDQLKPGDCVVMESGLSCGICDICKNGTYNMCPQLFHNGFFSTYQTHPADLCHKIPKNLTMEDATLTSTLALACQACFKAHITPITSVLIIGTCATACAAALCARALGAKAVAILSSNVYTLESIRILFDIDYIHYYEDEPNLLAKVTERVCSVLRDRPTVVINYSISESTMNLTTNLLQSSGTCVLAECDQEHARFNAMDVIMKNITIVPSFRSASMFPTALHLMRTGKTPIGELISRIYTWDQVRWAFHWAQYESNMGNRKVIVQCPENS